MQTLEFSAVCRQQFGTELGHTLPSSEIYIMPVHPPLLLPMSEIENTYKCVNVFFILKLCSPWRLVFQFLLLGSSGDSLSFVGSYWNIVSEYIKNVDAYHVRPRQIYLKLLVLQDERVEKCTCPANNLLVLQVYRSNVGTSEMKFNTTNS